VLKSDNPALTAIATFGQADVPLEWAERGKAADVIVSPRGGSSDRRPRIARLHSLTRHSQELEEVLSERTESHKKYVINHASAAEIKNLRKTFKEVERMVAQHSKRTKDCRPSAKEWTL
jgi:hypothetical protein